MSPQSDKKATTARWIMRRMPTASLGTIDKRTGEPYVSFVPVALDHDGTPLLLLSDLSEHTLNIGADPRVSLLFDATREADVPADGARLTFQGHIAKTGEPRHARRYLARHATAEMYAGFADFSFYAVDGRHAHLVEGFGRARWLRARDILLSPEINGRLDPMEVAWIGRVVDGRHVTGLDPDGIDLRLEGTVGRIWSEEPAMDEPAFSAIVGTGAGGG
ncbi:MAG: pyridoxamine 5'-phosphate oxidase family protein [Geminicoccaceae bacterium]|nr:pyridoxamine 5'-phosphate oxidase family protein [Geminicoccaceae bacterium]